jgi:hypothetical protein
MALDLGPCAVFFGTEDAEVDLGKTHGGVKVAFSQATAELLSDQFGTEPEDEMITGHGALITIPMADYSLANFAIALHKDVLDLAGESGILGDSVVGTKLSTYANSLILKKYVNGAVSEDEENWIRFPKAAPKAEPEITFDGATQRVINTVFRAFPNASGILYYIGSKDAAEGGS